MTEADASQTYYEGPLPSMLVTLDRCTQPLQPPESFRRRLEEKGLPLIDLDHAKAARINLSSILNRF